MLDRHFKLYEDRENTHEQCKREKEERKKKYRDEANDRNRINKAFEKINRFDRSNPDQCLPWMEEIFAMACTHKRNTWNELIYNSGGSVQKTLYSLPSGASEDEICDLLLHNHSNLKTSAQCISAFDSLQQKNEEPLQTYNARYQSYYELAHKGLTITSNRSKVSCIHYAKSLHGKPNLYMGSLVKNWKGGSTRGYLTIYKMHLTGPWTLNPGSKHHSASTPGMSMRSTTLTSAVTTKNLRSVSCNTSVTPALPIPQGIV